MVFPKRTTIQTHTITIVPRYAETDQGGMVHHSVYPVWFEMGRTELLRVNGLVYKDLEQARVFFVIAELYIKYRQPAKYDEKLQLETSCSGVTASKIELSGGLLAAAMEQSWLRARASLPASMLKAKFAEYLNLCIPSPFRDPT